MSGHDADRLAVIEAVGRYNLAFDDADPDAFRAIALPTFAVRHTVAPVASDDLESFLTALAAERARFQAWQHLFSQPVVAIDGDSALVRVNLIGFHKLVDEPGAEAKGGASYRMQLRRTAEGWRFAAVEITARWADAALMRAYADGDTAQ